MKRLKRLLGRLWLLVSRPAVHLRLGFLTLGGFLGGVVFWGGFNTALELTNTERFCISCHEMPDPVYQELTRTVPFPHPPGLRPPCPSAHHPPQCPNTHPP